MSEHEGRGVMEPDAVYVASPRKRLREEHRLCFNFAGAAEVGWAYRCKHGKWLVLDGVRQSRPIWRRPNLAERGRIRRAQGVGPVLLMRWWEWALAAAYAVALISIGLGAS